MRLADYAEGSTDYQLKSPAWPWKSHEHYLAVVIGDPVNGQGSSPLDSQPA